MPTVFVVQENPHLDYSDAERFGEVEFITNIEFSPIKGSLNNERVLTDIRHAMAKFDPHRDYLLMTGNPISIGYAFHLAIRHSYLGTTRVPLNLLRWDGITRRYQHVTFQH